MIEFKEMGKMEETFFWRSPTGRDFIWATSRMREYAVETKREIYTVDLDMEFAQYALTNYGLEIERLRRIKPHMIANSPIIYAAWDKENMHTLVDGCHRYVMAALLGHEKMNAYVFPQKDHEAFMIKNFPAYSDEFARQYLLGGKSGL